MKLEETKLIYVIQKSLEKGKHAQTCFWMLNYSEKRGLQQDKILKNNNSNNY